MSKAFIESLTPSGYTSAIRAGLEWIGLGGRIRPGDRVFIKPNLTFPWFQPGVMTSMECLEGLVMALSDYRCKVTVVEADSGGYNRFRIDEVFERIGLNQLARRYGFEAINLSCVPFRNIRIEEAGRELSVPLPIILMEEADLLLTVPVPKVHCNSMVSLAVKNQWGCIPDTTARLKLHPYFPAVIHAVNQALRTAVAVVDGRYGLTRNGPLRGDVVEPGWLLVCDDIYTTDLICCGLMQIPAHQVPHLRYLKRIGALPNEDAVVFNREYQTFIREKFYLAREWTDYPGVLAFRSSFVAYWAYHSFLAGFLHKVLYLFREPFY